MCSKNEFMRSSQRCALNELMRLLTFRAHELDCEGGEERCRGRCGEVCCGVGEMRGGVGVKRRVEGGVESWGRGRCGRCWGRREKVCWGVGEVRRDGGA